MVPSEHSGYAYRAGAAAAVLDQLRAQSSQASYLAPALAWLDGWLAEQRGQPAQAAGSTSAARTPRAPSPVYTARLLLAHGRLLSDSRRPAPA